ncbi:BTAD domain-containing putative transcriptional regulator [Dactylosporangium sp. NPDC051485]|uniref:BTAD domain-containing putative transcriptional regulator n=1 Tax=Dactylosporangium sp. NPDC051485 TaxID=3154846 RepID=UPI0034199B1F
MLMHRLGRTIVRATSALTLLALLGGLPTALVTFAGWPLPRSLPTDWAGWSAILTGGFPDTAVVNLLTIALWLVWAAFCYSLLGELVAARRGRPARTIRVISPMQALAALLIAGLSAAPAAASVAVIAAPAPAVSHATTAAPATLTAAPATDLPWLTVTTTSTAGATGTAGAVTDIGAVTAPVGGPLTDLPRFAAVAYTGPLTVSTAGQQYTVTVQRGDTLWEIAETWLGDPHRWTEIYQLNADRYDSTGRMHGGDHIEPTWVLILPADATPPAGAQPAAPPAQADPGNSDDDPSHTQGPGQNPPSTTAPATTAPATTAPATTAPATTAPSTAAPGTSQPASSAPDDGVVEPPVAASTGDTASSASPASSGPALDATAGDTTDDSSSTNEHGGVSLLSGSWVDLGLALAVIAAVTLIWAHRRRRYTPRPPSAQLRLDDPDLAPMPPMISRLRHGLRRPVPDRDNVLGSLLDDQVPDDTDSLPFHDDGDSFIDADDDADDPDTDDTEDDGRADAGDEDRTGEQDAEDDGPADELPVPVVPALTNPIIAVWPPAGLGLTGPRAEDAARGFLAAALAAGAEDPQARTHVVMPSATAATLLGAAAVDLPGTPRLTITGGLDEALELLEAQTLHRTRLVYRHEVDSITQLRAADPLEEPVEPILLIADAAAGHERARVAALLAQGQRLDIHAVVLGAWPDGDTVVVAADGTTSPAAGEQARHGGHPADVGRLAVLTPAETADLVTLLAESHTGRAPTPAPAERPGPTTPAGPTRSEPVPTGTTSQDDAAPVAVLIVEHTGTGTAGPRPTDIPTGIPTGIPTDIPTDIPTAIPVVETEQAATHPNTDRVGEPEEPPASAEGPHHTLETSTDQDVPASAGAEPADTPLSGSPADREPDGPDEAVPDPAPAGGEAVPAMDAGVRVLVLGPPRIVDMDMSKGAARAKSVELLVYLAVHDGPVHYEPITDDLLPEAPAKKAPHRLHTYVSALRDVLRRTGGPTEYVPRSGDRYQLNRDVLDLDLWRMQQALRDAEQSTDPAVRIAAWRHAVGLYRGDLAAGTDYEWIEPYREAVRQQVLDAVLALADALTDEPAESLPILAAALEHSPYTEALYVAAFRAHAALGDIDAIRALRRTLTRHLADIDTEPTEETTALAEHLVAELQTPQRRTAPRPAPRPAARPAARPDEDAAA